MTADENADAHSVTLSHAISGGDYGSVSADDAKVNILAAPSSIIIQVGVTPSAQQLTVVEGGSQDYSLVLNAAPTGDVEVNITLPSGTDLSLHNTTLTFTTADWSAPQTITVSADEDDDATTDDPVEISHASSGGGYDNTPTSVVRVSIMENDSPGVTVSTETLPLNEGTTGTYTVVLDTQPTGEVHVTVDDPGNTDVTTEPASLTFTMQNWSTPQTVTVSAGQDADSTGDEATVTHNVSGADYALA